jgi:protein O-GlcNAc transferase
MLLREKSERGLPNSSRRVKMPWKLQIRFSGFSRIPQRKQIKFIPFTTPERFRSIVALADVVLDTLNWSGGNTSLDALSVGTPIVTLPGAFMRGRQSMAMLDALGVPDLIADTTDAFVSMALRVADDHEYNRSLRQRILANNGEVFDRPEPVRVLEACLESIYQSRLVNDERR